jgi:GNAT superfamily N-acetyltransferase
LAITNPDENGISLIEYVEIFKEYQGKGFYKMLLKAAFELNSSLDMLLSKDRNEDSNPIYQKWLGFEFGFRRHVTISICDNELIFN